MGQPYAFCEFLPAGGSKVSEWPETALAASWIGRGTYEYSKLLELVLFSFVLWLRSQPQLFYASLQIRHATVTCSTTRIFYIYPKENVAQN